MTRNAGKSFLLNGATATTWSAVGTLVGQLVVPKDPVLCKRNTTDSPTYWLTAPYQLWLGRLDFIDRPFVQFSLCLGVNVFCGLWAKRETFHVTYPGYVLDVSLVKGNRVFWNRLLGSCGWRGWAIRELLISFFFANTLEMDAMSGKGYVGDVHKNLYAAAAPVCCLCRLQDLWGFEGQFLKSH